MTQGTQIALGVGAVAIVGFLYVNNQNKKQQDAPVIDTSRKESIVWNPKVDERFAPVDIKPLNLKPVSNPFQAKKTLTQDAIFEKVLTEVLPFKSIQLDQKITLPIISSLDLNLVLKFGSKGLEVKELQRLLDFSEINRDGIFGKNTLLALQKRKKTSSITLNKF